MNLKLIALISIWLSFSSPCISSGAIPIKQSNEAYNAATISNTSIEQGVQLVPHPEPSTINRNREKNDDGINGALSFLFSLFGFFPLAIIFGIIGIQKHRKLKGLAVAGLVMSLLTTLYLIIVLLYISDFFAVI